MRSRSIDFRLCYLELFILHIFIFIFTIFLFNVQLFIRKSLILICNFISEHYVNFTVLDLGWGKYIIIFTYISAYHFKIKKIKFK